MTTQPYTNGSGLGGSSPPMQCRNCKEWKPFTPDHFVRRKGQLRDLCKLCNVIQSYRSSRKHKEQRDARKPRVGRPPKVKELPETELGEAIKTFLEGRKNLAYETKKGYLNALTQYAQAFPDFPPTAQNVTDWLSQSKFAETTKMTNYGYLRAFAHWLRKTKRTPGDPLEGIVRPRKVENLPRAPKEADIKGLLSFLESRVEYVMETDPTFTNTGDTYRDVRDLAIFSLMLDTGLRVGEVANLDMSDVDFEEMSVFVCRAKNKKQRYVMFGKRVKGNLKLWLAVRQTHNLDKKLQALFVSEWGCFARMSRNGIEEALRARCKAAGVKQFTPHQLRHAHASQSIKNGQNIEELRQQMGHSNIAMTARYFMLPSEGRQKSHLKTSPLDHL